MQRESSMTSRLTCTFPAAPPMQRRRSRNARTRRLFRTARPSRPRTIRARRMATAKPRATGSSRGPQSEGSMRCPSGRPSFMAHTITLNGSITGSIGCIPTIGSWSRGTERTSGSEPTSRTSRARCGVVAKEGTAGEWYNVGDRNAVTIDRMIELAANALDTDVDLVHASDRELSIAGIESTDSPLYRDYPHLLSTAKLASLG